MSFNKKLEYSEGKPVAVLCGQYSMCDQHCQGTRQPGKSQNAELFDDFITCKETDFEVTQKLVMLIALHLIDVRYMELTFSKDTFKITACETIQTRSTCAGDCFNWICSVPSVERISF